MKYIALLFFTIFCFTSSAQDQSNVINNLRSSQKDSIRSYYNKMRTNYPVDKTEFNIDIGIATYLQKSNSKKNLKHIDSLINVQIVNNFLVSEKDHSHFANLLTNLFSKEYKVIQYIVTYNPTKFETKKNAFEILTKKQNNPNFEDPSIITKNTQKFIRLEKNFSVKEILHLSEIKTNERTKIIDLDDAYTFIQIVEQRQLSDSKSIIYADIDPKMDNYSTFLQLKGTDSLNQNFGNLLRANFPEQTISKLIQLEPEMDFYNEITTAKPDGKAHWVKSQKGFRVFKIYNQFESNGPYFREKWSDLILNNWRPHILDYLIDKRFIKHHPNFNPLKISENFKTLDSIQFFDRYIHYTDFVSFSKSMQSKLQQQVDSKAFFQQWLNLYKAKEYVLNLENTHPEVNSYRAAYITHVYIEKLEEVFKANYENDSIKLDFLKKNIQEMTIPKDEIIEILITKNKKTDKKVKRFKKEGFKLKEIAFFLNKNKKQLEVIYHKGKKTDLSHFVNKDIDVKNTKTVTTQHGKTYINWIKTVNKKIKPIEELNAEDYILYLQWSKRKYFEKLGS